MALDTTQDNNLHTRRRASAFYITAFVILGTLVLAVSVVASVPSLRQRVRAVFQKPYRIVLAKARGDLTGQGFIVSVVKLKSLEGISVEVYERLGEGEEERLLARLPFEERRDGHFSIRGQATNLALVDLDGDGILELVVPVYDENLIPRLHVFRYDPVGKIFIRLGPEAMIGL